MTRDDELIKRVEDLIMADCIDAIFVGIARVKKFLKSDKGTCSYYDIADEIGTTLNPDVVIGKAIDNLVRDGKIVKYRSCIRAKLSFEK